MALGERLSVALGCAACCISCPARATPADSTKPAAPSNEPGVRPEAMVRNDELEQIIVTARRRQEELQTTPVSVISLSARDLEARSVTNLRAMQYFVPNLTFAPSQNVGESAGNAFIRGIGQEDFVAGAEPGVGFYLDGVYVARTMGTLLNLVDIDRVEVLRGPQGTLYGKNTIGGAINVMSVTPQVDAAAYADLIVGNIGRFDLRGMINVPLTDRLLARLAVGYFSRDGYLERLRPPFPPTPTTETSHEGEGRDDSAVGRLQVRWLASERLTVDLAADASRRRGTQGAIHIDAIDPRFGILPAVNELIRDGMLPGPEIISSLVTGDLLKTRAGGGNHAAQDFIGASMVVTHNLGDHQARLTGAYRRLRSDVATDLDGTYFALLPISEFDERYRQYSAELQLTGTVGNAKYNAGLFAMQEAGELLPVARSGQDVLYQCGCYYTPENRPKTLFPERQVKSTSYAIYGQGSAPVTEQLSVTLGARYSFDRKSVDGQLTLLDPETLEPSEAIATGSNSESWGSLTWRAGLEFQATPDMMAYFSAGKGFKSGGFNVRPVINLPNLGLARFAPETAITYEAGIRSQWLQRRLRLNATLFQTNYRDIQLRQQTISGGVVTTLIENAARARIRGLEIEAQAKPLADLAVGFAYGHLDARYLDVGRVTGLTLDTEFQRTPGDSFTASFDYVVELANGHIALRGDYSYRSHEQFQLLPSPWDQSGYGLLGARVTWQQGNGRWSLALFGTNLTDERYRTAGRGTLITQTGFAYSSVGLPRQVGVELKLGF